MTTLNIRPLWQGSVQNQTLHKISLLDSTSKGLPWYFNDITSCITSATKCAALKSSYPDKCLTATALF